MNCKQKTDRPARLTQFWVNSKTAIFGNPASCEQHRRTPALLIPLLAFSIAFAVGQRAEASHFRGVDASASIDTNGVIDPTRFGQTTFVCPDGTPFTVSVPGGLRIERAGATVVTFIPFNELWFAAPGSPGDRTTATDTSNPVFNERTQQLVIPLGTSSGGLGDVIFPLGLAFGTYDIISGIQNMNEPGQFTALAMLW